MLLAIISFIAIAPSPVTKIEPHANAQQATKLSAISPVKDTEAATLAAAQAVPTAPEPKPFDVNDRSTWPVCPETHIVWAQDGQCHEKPAQAAPVAQAAISAGSGSGSCEAEIAKYGWNQSVALAVAKAESGFNPGIVNDNPATRDYSVGCFQVNIYGANARNRPSEAALKNAATNVQWAYNNYVGNGHSFLGQWGVCRRTVACY